MTAIAELDEMSKRGSSDKRRQEFQSYLNCHAEYLSARLFSALKYGEPAKEKVLYEESESG